jgi:biopolymer transport protein TolQ
LPIVLPLVPDPGNGNLWEDIASMTLFSKGIMFILIMMSVISWAIMLYKYFEVRKIYAVTDRFQADFRKRRSIDDFINDFGRYRLSPFAGMMKSAFGEIKGLIDLRSMSGGTGKAELDEDDLNLVADSIDRAGAEEGLKLERGIIFLATTANAAPFLGLLGTVVGIYVAFKDIGARGTATLAVVAPAIAEALIATAAGLAVAIPALIGYNYFVNRNRLMTERIDNFKSELFSAFKKEMESVEKV